MSKQVNISKLKSDYHFWYSDKVRFNDLDALGHASSVTINAYFAGARTQLFNSGVPEWPNAQIMPIMKASSIEYIEELFMLEEIDIGLAVSNFGNTSFTLDMALFSDETCKAVTQNTFVFVDRQKKEKTPPPDIVRVNFMNLTSRKGAEAV